MSNEKKSSLSDGFLNDL